MNLDDLEEIVNMPKISGPSKHAARKAKEAEIKAAVAAKEQAK